MFKYQVIRKLIEEEKLSKKTTVQMMATKMGMSTKSLEDYRDGKSTPSVEKAEKIAIYFKKDMNYFFDIEEWQSVELPIGGVAETTPPYASDMKDKMISQLEGQVTSLQQQLEDQSTMLNAFRTGAIKVVDSVGNENKNSKCG